MAKPRPVCIECLIEMTPQKNGVHVETVLKNKEPYEIWQGDLWQCPTCGQQIVCGYGERAVAEHWQPNFLDQKLILSDSGNFYTLVK